MTHKKQTSLFKVQLLRRFYSWLAAWATTPNFQKGFAWISVGVLLATTIFWSVLSALVHQGNADQLVNAYLFEDSNTLHAASMPAQHTFLLKWPLFWLIKMLGYTDIAYIAVTALCAVVTVAALACVISRMVRKPLVSGLVYLALAALLLLVPAQPYAGAMLPVNMGMLTTRNIEYIVYLAALITLLRLPKIAITAWRFWAAAGLLCLLIASDKLFLTLSIGGAFVTLVVFVLRRNQVLIAFAFNWLAASIIGTIAASGLLWCISMFVTHIFLGGDANPYGLVHNLHDFGLGLAYGVLGLFTNLGANLAFDATQLKHIPLLVTARLFTFEGLAFIINVLITGASFVAVKKLVSSIAKRSSTPNAASTLVVALVASTVVACAAFVATNHYYPVDARYLTIAFFAAAVALAIYAREQKWLSKKIVPVCAILILGIAAGTFTAWLNYTRSAAANASLSNRNARVAAAMIEHGGGDVLLGDYWRVLPVRQASKNAFKTLPLSSCVEPRGVLTSTAWLPDTTQPFAYLLTYDSHSPDFPVCSLPEIIAKYGRPNASTIIEGSLDAPKEMLLFYDHGVNSNPSNNPNLPSTVVPISLESYPESTCKGKTIFSTVAHEDDDLLFMNPDQLNAIKAGDCLRTVYITAGDAGGGDLYWLGREKGSQEAHDWMDGPEKDVWLQRIVRLGDHQYVTIATPRNNPNISLIFMRLPDGNTSGDGFEQNRFESLAGLESGRNSTLTSVDGQAIYTKVSLNDALVKLMNFYKPGEVRTQAPLNLSSRYPDHSDHLAVGHYTQLAYQQYKTQTDSAAPINYYVGYPIHESPPNVFGQDYQDKAQAFFIYSQYDGGGCTTFVQCDTRTVYGEYLKRQYTKVLQP